MRKKPRARQPQSIPICPTGPMKLWISRNMFRDFRVLICCTITYLVFFRPFIRVNSTEITTNFRFSMKDPKQPLITYSNMLATTTGNRPTALLVYTTCHIPGKIPAPFSIWKTSIPAIGLECNQTTRTIDCNEAVPYLNFIIDHYDKPLADKYIFAHGHDNSWHYQGDFFDALENLLNSTYFRKMSYGGVFRGYYFKGAWGDKEDWWARPLYRFIFKNTSMPADPIERNNQRPCCATFWLNSDLIKNRKKSEYIEMRNKLREWSITHADAKPDPAWYCGRTMEYNWHIIFTKKAYIEECHLCQGDQPKPIL